ncbi:MAG: phospholipase D-like domain-containing protein [Pseudomonadota bacterium]
MKRLPPGLSFEGPAHPVADVRFLGDLTWVDAQDTRHTEQQIFDEVFRLVQGAHQYVVLDLFLYNSFQGREPERTRALSSELTRQLLQKRKSQPDVPIVLITDPINTVYGGIRSAEFEALQDAGIQVVITDLNCLPDSNPCYSVPWRLLLKPFGTGPGRLMPNPFGKGRVSLRSWLCMLNFKANHRKVIIADDSGIPVGLVTSANPHDGSSAHRNVALRFTGPAVLDLLQTEIAVLALSGVDVALPCLKPPSCDQQTVNQHIRILTEGKIKEAVLAALAQNEAGGSVDLLMFYLSDREVIDALQAAHQRGVKLRILLDPNKDAFGWRKNGIPNRPVAHELVQQGIAVRWCDTHGEQCHAKMLLTRYPGDRASLICGSANLTRRNLDDLNLETNVELLGTIHSTAIHDAGLFFEQMWRNDADRLFSVDYPMYRDTALWKRLLYRLQEASGMGTF